MTATYVLPTSNSVRKNNPLASSSSPLLLLSSSSLSSSTEIPQRSIIPPPPPPILSTTTTLTTDDSVATPKTMASSTTTTTTHHHHDIFISLTSPTLIKKKKMSNEDGIEFRTTTTAADTMTSTTTTTNRHNNHNGTSRCLTPASVQLLRSSLLRTYNQHGQHTQNVNDTETLNVTRINNNIRNSRYPPTNDSTYNKSHGTVKTTHHQVQQQQQQHKMKYRTLKRLDTEPIPVVRTNPLSSSNNNNASSGASTATLPQRQRRQIFGTFWDTTSGDPADARRHSSTRSRSNSDAVETTMEPCTIRKPPSLHTRSKSEGFQCNHNHVETSADGPNTTTKYSHASLFMSLPSPMQRLRKSSGGVYPLVQPKSILRKNNYHQHPMIHGDPTAENNSRDNHQHVPDDGSSTNTDYDRTSSICSSTNSIPNTPNDTTTEIVTTTSHCTGSDCNNNNDINRKPLVHFDPRITITELFGRDHDRVWYSDGELNRFKYETVVTARAYFNQHPDQIVYYNQPFYDPVTKTMRKRALFNLPALANITITEQDDHGPPKTTAATTVPCATSIRPATEKLRDKETPTSPDDGLQQDHQQLLSLLAFENGGTILRTSDQSSSDTNCTSTSSSPNIDTIRSVLIVDHNQWILDLFVRSVRAMFNGDSKDGCGGDAVVVECAPNATVAMAIINDVIASRQREPPFDLIIAEQLPPPSQTVQQPSTVANVVIHEIGDGDATASPYPANTTLLSGAELLFQSLPPEYREQILLISVTQSSFAKSSNQSAASASTLNTNIALVTSDLVWSKPPPRMDHILCMQLIRTLQKKREQRTCRTNDIEQQSGLNEQE